MTIHWATEDLPGQRWDPDPEPDDGDDGPWCGTVTAFDLRQIEIHDQRGQGVGPAALWTAHTVPLKGDLL